MFQILAPGPGFVVAKLQSVYADVKLRYLRLDLRQLAASGNNARSLVGGAQPNPAIGLENLPRQGYEPIPRRRNFRRQGCRGQVGNYQRMPQQLPHQRLQPRLEPHPVQHPPDSLGSCYRNVVAGLFAQAVETNYLDTAAGTEHVFQLVRCGANLAEVRCDQPLVSPSQGSFDQRRVGNIRLYIVPQHAVYHAQLARPTGFQHTLWTLRYALEPLMHLAQRMCPASQGRPGLSFGGKVTGQLVLCACQPSYARLRLLQLHLSFVYKFLRIFSPGCNLTMLYQQGFEIFGHLRSPAH